MNTLSGYHPELEAIDVKMRACGRPSPPAADWLRFKGGMPKDAKGIAAFQSASTQWKAELVAWEKANPEAAIEYAILDSEYMTAEDRLEGLKWTEQREHYLQERMRRMGVPAKCVRAAESISETKAMTAARAWFPKPTWALTLFGGFGTGKTTAAAWCIQEWIRRGHRTQWARAPQLSNGTLLGAEANVYADSCRTCDVLVIDDLGADRMSDVWRAWLEDVLDARWGAQRKTLLTVNGMDGTHFAERMGGRIMDRLRDGERINCGDGSLRGDHK